MHPVALRKMIEGVVAACALTSAGCGCLIGRGYGPSTSISVTKAPARVRSATIAADGTLDEKACAEICGEYVVSCAIASADPKLQLRPSRQEQDGEPQPVSADERFVVCHINRPGGCDVGVGSSRGPLEGGSTCRSVSSREP